jgi:hypothetical protein
MNDCLVFEGFETLNDEPIKPHEVASRKVFVTSLNQGEHQHPCFRSTQIILMIENIFPRTEMACL